MMLRNVDICPVEKASYNAFEPLGGAAKLILDELFCGLSELRSEHRDETRGGVPICQGQHELQFNVDVSWRNRVLGASWSAQALVSETGCPVGINLEQISKAR